MRDRASSFSWFALQNVGVVKTGRAKYSAGFGGAGLPETGHAEGETTGLVEQESPQANK